METIRIDKWLWAVRLYKTRSQAADACRGGKVKLDGQNTKPSREVKADDIIDIQLKGINKKVRIIKAHKNRVAAKFVPELMEDLTSPEEYEKLDMLRQLNIEKRDRGTGRPTKKDRRTISRLKDNE